jgi:hypothetical protein
VWAIHVEAIELNGVLPDDFPFFIVRDALEIPRDDLS